MSMKQLIEQSGLQWFTKRRITYLGVGLTLFVIAVYLLSASEAKTTKSEEVD